MPLVSPEALERALQRGEKGGAFYLFGDEEFLKEELVSSLVAAHLDPSTRDFNLDQLRGTEVSAETLGSVLQTPPMMAEWRVVVVREAHGLAASARLREVVESILERPPDGLALVLSATPPSRTKARFYQRMTKLARAVEVAMLPEADLPGWLMQRASAEGVELEPQAARALASAIGSDLGILVSELRKLRDFVGDRGRIAVADVESAVGAVARQNRWEWFDLVGERRLGEARSTLPVLLDAGESGVGLIIGLGAQMLRLALAVQGGESALASELPPHQRWLARRLMRQARRWTAEVLDAALEDLLRADRLLKSTSLDERQIMEELLLRLQAGRAAA